MKLSSRQKAEKLIENILKQKEIKIDDWSMDSHDHGLGCFYILDIDNKRIVIQEEPNDVYSITFIDSGSPLAAVTFSKKPDPYIGWNIEKDMEKMIKILKEKGFDQLLEGII